MVRRQVSVLVAGFVVLVGLVVGPVVGARASGLSASSRPDCASAPAQHVSAMFLRPDASDAPLQDDRSWWGDPNSSTGSKGTEWAETISQLKALCADQIVLQWTANTWAGTDPYFHVTYDSPANCVVGDGVVPAGATGGPGRFVRPVFPSTTPAWEQSRLAVADQSGTCGRAAAAARSDQVGGLLAAAKNAGVRVWLGLQIDEVPWFGNGRDTQGWMDAQTQLSKEIFDQLWAKYGATYKAQIAGVYLPFEANTTDYRATDTPSDPVAHAQFTRFQLLNGYMDTVSKYVTGKVPGLGVMASPYHVASIGADPASSDQVTARGTYSAVVKNLVTGSSVSVWAPQDAVGAQYETTDDVAAWMVAARAGLDGAGTTTKLWGTVELYSRQGVANMPVQQVVLNMAAMNKPVGGASAHLDGWAGFSGNAMITSTWWWNWRANQATTAAYATYLRYGWAPTQKVPAIGADSYPGNNQVTAALLGSSFDVSVQWPMLAASKPQDSNGTGVVIPVAGYQVFRDGAPIGQVPQPLQRDWAATNQDQYGFQLPDTGTNGVLAFTDPSMQTGRTYTYQVAAFDAYGNPGPKSPGTTVTVPLTAADAVSTAGTATTDSALGERISAGAPYTVVAAGADPASVWSSGVPATAPWADGQVRPKLADGITGEANYADPA